jgi:hypothetical protein
MKVAGNDLVLAGAADYYGNVTYSVNGTGTLIASVAGASGSDGAAGALHGTFDGGTVTPSFNMAGAYLNSIALGAAFKP